MRTKKSKPSRFTLPETLRLAVEQLEVRRLLTINWTGLGDGTSWGDGNNWAGNSVPGILDDAAISIPATVVFSTGTGNVHSLTVGASDTFSITGGAFTVNANSTISGTLAITGGSLTATGSGTTFTANGTTTASEAGLIAASGATLSLPHLTSYTDSTTTEFLQATGTGSLLSLPALTTLSTSNNVGIFVRALAGGHVTFAALTQVLTSPVNFQSDGTGSQIDVSALATFHGTVGNNDSSVALSNSGTFLHGAITTLDRVDLSADGATTSLTFSALTSVSNGNITASGGNTLSLPALASYTDSITTYFLTASGTSSLLSLPALTTLSTSNNVGIFVRALGSGHVTFAALTQVLTSPVNFQSDGAGSQIDVSALATFHGTVGNNDSLVQLSNSGTFLHGAITTLDRVDLSADGATTSLTFSALTSISNGNITASGGNTLSLPAVTSYTDSVSAYFLTGTGAGSLLSLPALTTLSTSNNVGIFVRALAGGHVTFAALTQVLTSPVNFQSDGAGSQIDVSALATFHGTVGNNDSSVALSAGGTFLHGAITTLDRVDLSADGPAASLTFSALTSISNGNITASGGNTLSLSAVTSYTDSVSTYFLTGTGAGSLLSLPALTTLSTSNNDTIEVRAQVGGHVTFAALTQIVTSPVFLQSDGAGSQIDVSALATFHGTVGNNNSSVALTLGGAFLHGAITTLDRVDLSADGATTSLTFSALTSISNGNITASGGNTLSLPAVTSYTDSVSTYFLTGTGAGSLLSLPALTTLSTSNNDTIEVRALAGGQVTFAALAQIVTSPVFLQSDGVGSQINFPALTNFQVTPAASGSLIQLTNGGAFNSGNNPNTTINNVSLTADAATNYTIQSNQTFSNDSLLMTIPIGTLIDQGNLLIDKIANYNIQGNLAVNGQGIITSGLYSTIKVTGNLLGTTQNFNQFNGQGIFVLNGAGTVGTPQQFEALSADLGAVQAGFNNNFAYGTLSLAGSTYVKLVDLADNAPGAGAEAVYVKQLNVPAGTTLDLNGLHLYVRNSSIAGTILNGSITQVGSAVVNRQLFYQGSTRYDVGGNPFGIFSDDYALATDKTAYLPNGSISGGTTVAATFSSVSSYSLGINGVIVDLSGSHPGVTAADFAFKVGNNNTPSTWSSVVPTPTVVVRPGGGTGSDRVELIWANNAIQKQWLEVTVNVTAHTGIASPDIFFFGNALADTGLGDTLAFTTDSINDELGVRGNPKSLLSNIPITNIYDFNRDGKVDSIGDELLARGNPTTALTAPKMIKIGIPPAAPEVALTSNAIADAGVGSALANTASTSLPDWLARRLDHLAPLTADLNHGPLARYFEHLADKNTDRSREILFKVDELADSLGMDDELVDSLLVSLGLE